MLSVDVTESELEKLFDAIPKSVHEGLEYPRAIRFGTAAAFVEGPHGKPIIFNVRTA